MGICNQRTVVITGAGGLGRAYALAFAQKGANVVVNDIRAEAAAAVADEVKAAGGQAIANTGDITTVAGAQSILDATLAAFGDVNVIVNNAGVLRDRMFLSLTEEDWDMVMRAPARPLLHGQGVRRLLAIRRRRAGCGCSHHQHQLRRGPARLHRTEQLRRSQGWYRRPDAGAGRRAVALRHYGQLPSTCCAHLHDRRRHARYGQARVRL
ncbi:SDR family NAD(P)-dependent oxidoreductase [Staphylococcus epidermidis]|nr:SDR family NAD(P)-dependent oxidoreductase [Staphylococcus epidermidis]